MLLFSFAIGASGERRETGTRAVWRRKSAFNSIGIYESDENVMN